jgi:NADH-quinone oxidoreductase subunit J
MGATIAFWALAAVIIVAALGVIVQKNVFRVALALIVCLLAVAGIFVLLSADFLAAAQILVYVGAISVVIILAIMLTRQFAHGSTANRLRLPALLVSIVLFALLTFAVLETDWKLSTNQPAALTTPALAGQLFGSNGFILPLEISAVLILAVVIGAIVIAREK